MRFEKELHLARSIAMHSGEVAIGYSTRGVVAEDKLDLTPVTIADRECEKLIVARIAETFPDDGILGEEGSNKPSRNGRKWIVDPIDGTRDFIRGLPLWAVLIGLEVDGVVEVGVVHIAAQNQMYSGVRGEGAWLNEKPIKCSAIDSASNAVLCFNGMNRMLDLPFGARLPEWLSQFWAVRGLGGCVDAMMLASGRADMWIETIAKPWDLAPLKVILEEAGVRFINFDGNSSIYGGNAIAYVPGLEAAVGSLLGNRATA